MQMTASLSLFSASPFIFLIITVSLSMLFLPSRSLSFSSHQCQSQYSQSPLSLASLPSPSRLSATAQIKKFQKNETILKLDYSTLSLFSAKKKALQLKISHLGPFFLPSERSRSQLQWYDQVTTTQHQKTFTISGQCFKVVRKYKAPLFYNTVVNLQVEWDIKENTCQGPYDRLGQMLKYQLKNCEIIFGKFGVIFVDQADKFIKLIFVP